MGDYKSSVTSMVTSSNAVADSTSQEEDRGPAPSLDNKRLLPPCKVCGVQATGFHYGVNTCEACKGFFRRSLLRTEEYQCAKNSKCIMQPGKRSLCPFCRHKQCLKVGMSKEGIKTGRYTYSKRTKDTLEIQKLKQDKHQEISEGEKSKYEAEILSIIAQVVGPVERKFPKSKDPDHIAMLRKMQKNYEAPQEKARLVTLPNPCSSGSKDSNTVPVYSRDSVTLSNLFGMMQVGIRGYISVVKELPNFKLLSMPDQIELIKSSMVPAWIIARHMAFDIERTLFTTINGFTVNMRDIAPPEFSDLAMQIADRLQKLKLSMEETLVLQALEIYSTDDCNLQNRELVEKTQAKFLTALEYLFTRNHPKEPHMMAKIVSILMDVRTLSYMFYDISGLSLKGSDITLPPLVMEVLDIS